MKVATGIGVGVVWLCGVRVAQCDSDFEETQVAGRLPLTSAPALRLISAFAFALALLLLLLLLLL